MKTQQIEIKRELTDYVESLDFEVGARKEIITFMISNKMDTLSEAFRTYHDEFKDYLIQFRIAKDEIEKFIRKEINIEKEYPKGFNWSLDYTTSILTISEMNSSAAKGCSSCSE